MDLRNPAPSYMRRNPPPPMDQQPIVFVYVPGGGTRAGHFVPRGTVPVSYANYTPQQPPPGCEQEQHVPGPSVAYNIAHQQNVSSSNMMPTGRPTCGVSSISAAYSPAPFQCLPPWLRPPYFVYPGDLLLRPLTLSLGPPFLHRKPPEWGIDFYIRVDRAGFYHTYPHVGGPFERLLEVEHAIERHLDGRYTSLCPMPI